jgi:saccharopine dehydrogenase-like NADP-dependent oxidoreductase
MYVCISCACVGRAIVEGLWRHGGFHIIIACRSIEQGIETAKEIREGGQGSGELEVY